MRAALFALLLSCQLLACSCPLAASGEGPSVRTYKAGSRELTYSKPYFWRTLGKGPAHFVDFARNSFSRESLPWVGRLRPPLLS